MQTLWRSCTTIGGTPRKERDAQIAGSGIVQLFRIALKAASGAPSALYKCEGQVQQNHMSEKTDFTLLHPMRVRWGECDPQGIVFNVNYFLYFDVGITEYMRALGYQGDSVLEFYTVNAQADFRGSAKFDDEIEVGVRCARLGVKSMTVAAAIFRDDDLLTEGALTYVHAELGTQNTSPLPKEFIERVLSFESTPPERS